MRILTGFLIVMAAALLWMLSPTTMAYDYKTDVRDQAFTSQATGVGATTLNVTLDTALYDSDLTTVTILSDLGTDVPAASTYNSSNRHLTVSGLTANTSRDLDVSYDVDALNTTTALANIIDQTPLFWLLAIIMLPVAGIGSILWEKARGWLSKY